MTKKDKLFHNWTIEEIDAELREAIHDGRNALIRVCQLLAAKKDRGVDDPLFRHPIFGWYAEVASGKINPEALWVFAGLPQSFIRKLSKMPFSVQIDLATGGKVSVVERTTAGEFKVRHRPVAELSAGALDRVFDDDGEFVHAARQKTMLRRNSAPSYRQARPIPVATSDGNVQIGRWAFTVAELRPVLGKLGYDVTPDSRSRA